MSAQTRPFLTLSQATGETGIPQEDLLLAVQVGALRGFVVGKRPVSGMRIDASALPAFAERWRAGERITAPAAKAESGVYLLFLLGDVVYVGRSTTLAARLRTHSKSGRKFDAVEVIPCDLERAIWLEKELIRTLQPKQNRMRYLGHAKDSVVALARAGL